ncbi:hypothetical protein V7x_28600 [Crateriforma conspicua]|uniref:Glycosyl transferase family 2 n=1 Tax=Crateriforma conspicua TaxID=2527996 RepID=A0A5C6FY24_9PLAN|nr:hypothetical protein [Crateriforma conspicua]TWU67286.1 hypothetical protein V7x_28600 [Crateriforma conspicua]
MQLTCDGCGRSFDVPAMPLHCWCGTTTPRPAATAKVPEASPPRPMRFAATTSRACPDIDQVRLVTFHFNPCRFAALARTYQRWVPTLGPLADALVCYEVVFDGDAPEIPGSIVIRARRDECLMWQKESLINRAVDETPDRCRYFAWIDHDLVFQDPDWLPQGVRRMRDVDAVACQLFGEIRFLGSDDRVLWRRRSAMTAWTKSRSIDGSPGGAWIADVQYLRDIGGLSDASIVGGGDQVFLNAMSGAEPSHFPHVADGLRRAESRWLRRAVDVKGNRPAISLCGVVFHLHHGDRKHRQYRDRNQLLIDHDYDPTTDVHRRPDGLLQWSSDKPGLHAAVAKYFADRREDG